MYICPNCNKTSETPMNFCSQCGTPMINQQPAPEPIPVHPIAEPVPVQPAPEPIPVQPVAEPAPAPAPAEPTPTPAQPAQPTYQPPVYAQPVYTQPVYVPQSEQKPVHLAKKIVGMALSIGGLVFAGLGLLYALLFAAVEGTAAFAFSFIFSFFSAPLSIVGLIMSNNNINCGDTSTMSRVGKRLGIVAVILTGVMLFIGILGLGFADSYYY